MPATNLLLRIAAAAVLAAAIAFAARRSRSLSRSGSIAAWITGTAVAGLGGWAPGVLLVLFFASSSLLSRTGGSGDRIARRGSERDAVQVAANGGIAALCALFSALDAGSRPIWLAGVAGSLAAVTADTWATEIGRRSRAIPRMITTGSPVPRGSSGGVTALGTAGSVAGALVIAIAAAMLIPAESTTRGAFAAAAAIALAGIAGSLVDSLIGAALQITYRCPACGQISERPIDACGVPGERAKGLTWVNNDVVNLAAALTGAAVAMLLLGS